VTPEGMKTTLPGLTSCHRSLMNTCPSPACTNCSCSQGWLCREVSRRAEFDHRMQ
jgi:hypothetical protein